MTEHHHPAIAEQISLQKECIAKCEREIETLGRELTQMTEQKQRHQCMIDAYIDAEQRFVAHQSVIPELAPQAQAPAESEPPKRVKRDVRGMIAECFAAAGLPTHLSEQEIVSRTGLPAASVYAYLMRAVKAGELEREGGLYRLPGGSRPSSQLSPELLAELRSEPSPPEMAPDGLSWPVPAPRWPPSPEKILDTIRRAGDMGMNREQLRIIGATSEQIFDLLGEGQIGKGDDDRYRIAEDRGEAAP